MDSARNDSPFVWALVCALSLITACGPGQGPPDAKSVAAKIETTAASAETPAALGKLKQQAQGQDAPALRNLGVALWIAHASNAASWMLARAVEANLKDWLAWNDLGAVLNTLGRYQLALEALEIADGLDPHNPLILANRAVSEDGLGHDDLAKTDLKAALGVAPSNPAANLAMGHLLEGAGDNAAAGPYLAKAQATVYTEDNDYELPDYTGDGTDPIPPLPYVHYPSGGVPAVDLGLKPPNLPDNWKAFSNTADAISRDVQGMVSQYTSLMNQANAIGVGNIPIEGTTAFQHWFYSDDPTPFTTLPNLEEAHWRSVDDLTLSYQSHETALHDTFTARTDALRTDLQAQLQPLVNAYLADRSCAGISDNTSYAACLQARDQRYCAKEASMRQATYAEAKKAYQAYFDAATARLQETADQMTWNVEAFTNADDYQAMILAVQAEVVSEYGSLSTMALEIAAAEGVAGVPADCGPPDPALAQAIRAALTGQGQRPCNSRVYVPIPPLDPVATIDVQCSKLDVGVQWELLDANLHYDTSTHTGMVFVGVGKSFGFTDHGGVLKDYGPSLKAEAGAFFAFDGKGVTDAGIQADVHASLGGPVFDSHAGVRVGIFSGVQGF